MLLKKKHEMSHVDPADHYCAWMGTKHSERKEVKTSTIGDVYGMSCVAVWI